MVNNLVGDINAATLSGSLTVTTADAGDNGIAITTGSANTTITANGAADLLTVNADAMADDTSLDLNGSAAYTASNLEANTDASGTSGALNLTYSAISDHEASLITGSGNVSIAGGNGADTITVTGLDSQGQVFTALSASANFNVSAGSNNQTITGSNTGNDTLNGGGGSDTLSFAGGAAVDTTLSSYANYAGSSSGQGNDQFSGFEILVGSANSDRLQGVASSELEETFLLNGANSGSASASAGGNSFSFSSYENVALNGGDDVLVLNGSASLAGSADGGAGNDRLDYTNYSAAVNVNLAENSATAIQGQLIGVPDDSSFEDVYGSDFGDELLGDLSNNRLRGQAGDDTILGMGGDDTLDGGDDSSGDDGNDVIVGGDGVDVIHASNGNDLISGGELVSTLGGLVVQADGAADTLSYADENEGLDVTINGGDTGFVEADASASISLDDLAGTYSQSGAQSIVVPTNQTTSNWTQTFAEIQRLVLTDQNDILRMENGGFFSASSPQGLAGDGSFTIDGGGGNLDILDYSSFDSSSPVIVNLSEGSFSFDLDANGVIDTTIGEIAIDSPNSATNINAAGLTTPQTYSLPTGDGSLTPSEPSLAMGASNGVTNFEVVVGGAGDDAIVGNSADNFIVGNDGADRLAGLAGNDTIYGGKGDDLIIPGEGADRVIAGEGINSILITSSDLAEDVFSVDPSGINVFVLNGDGGITSTSTIQAPANDWNPGAQGIDLLDGGDPEVGSDGNTIYDTILGTSNDDNYDLSGTALNNIGTINLGDGNDSVVTSPTSKGIKVLYEGGSGTDNVTLTLTFQQFARLNQSGLYVSDVQNYLDAPSGGLFRSDQADFVAAGFETSGIAVVTPAVYNALQGDPAALTFNTSIGLSGVSTSSGEDLALAANAAATSTATARSTADLVSAFVQANNVKGADAITATSGADLSGAATASQTASASAITVDDRSDAVLSAYALGIDRSALNAGGDANLTLSGTVQADTVAEAGASVVTANAAAEAAGSRDSSLSAANSLNATINASVNQRASAGATDGLAIAGLATRSFGIDDANVNDAAADSVQAGQSLALNVSASAQSQVNARSVGGDSIGAITLVNNGLASTDRFLSSAVGAAFPLIQGDRLRFRVDTPLAGGSLAADRDYFVLNIFPVTGEFQLSSTPGGTPIDVSGADNGQSLQAYRPAIATADAISGVTGVDLNRSGAGLGGLQAGTGLSLNANASDTVQASAASVDGEATAGLNRLGGLDGLDSQLVSRILAVSDTTTLASDDAALLLTARDSVLLQATSTAGDALAEGNAQVLASSASPTTAGGDVNLRANASLSQDATATTTSGRAEARSGAGAGAGSSTRPAPTAPSLGNAVPQANTYGQATALADGDQSAGGALQLNATASLNLRANASTVDGLATLGNLWSDGNNTLSTFDPAASSPSPSTSQLLADGQRVQLDAASAGSLGLLVDTDYVVRLLASTGVDAGTNRIAMPADITYSDGDAIRFRLNSTTASNSATSRYGLALGTTYYVVNAGGGSFQVATTPGGAVIDLVGDSAGVDDQLVDADRFQLLEPPLLPGDPYSIALLTANQSGLAILVPSEAAAFAGSRQAGPTLVDTDALELARVSAVDGTGLAAAAGLLSVAAGTEANVSALADGVLNAQARNTAGDATASAGLEAVGINQAAIQAGGAGAVQARASIDAVADATTVGDSASVDNSLSSLNLAARGIDAATAGQSATIAADGDLTVGASISARAKAEITTGAADATAVLNATGLRASDAGFAASIGEVGDISASARLGTPANPSVVSAISGALGQATAQAAPQVIGLLGTFAAGDFASVQAGAAQGDLSAMASADQQTRASSTNGMATVMLADVAGTGSAELGGVRNMALQTGGGFNRITASAIGAFQQEASSVGQTTADAVNGTASTLVYGILSDQASPLPVTIGGSGAISALANTSTVSRLISVAGDASGTSSATTLGMDNVAVLISGQGDLSVVAVSRSSNQAQTTLGTISA